MLRSLFLLFNTAVLLLMSACFFEPPPFDETQWRHTVENTDRRQLYADNYNNGDGHFYNPWLAQQNRSFSAFLRWRLSKTGEYSDTAQNHLPAVLPDLIKRISSLPPSTDFLTWIGHNTFLFRINGTYWLTDPMFSDRALLPKRRTPPAVQADELRKLQGPIRVLLSHNHYDHLDAESLENLPEGTASFVPKGLGDYVAAFTGGPVTEMNWWEAVDFGNGVRLTCLPAQHWSRRIFQGYNSTLWASFMVNTPGMTIYFGGDSGYFKGYREIGEIFEDIDYAILPITAYEPRWFMHYAHMDTAEAIRAFQELGAAYFIPSQWGTFHLGDNPPGLPPLQLQDNIDRMQIDASKYLILDIGEIREL